MKWIKTAAFAILIFGFAASVRGDDRILLVFRNIVVIDLPGKPAAVARTVDRRGAEIKFDKWAPEIEGTIKEALAESSLKYRLHPLREAIMSVEIYSPIADVDFTFRGQRKSGQLIVGELREERAIADLLKLYGGAPIEEVADLLRGGNIVAAGELLFTQVSQKPSDLDFLSQTRFALIDFIRRGQGGSECPLLPKNLPAGADVSEGLLLNAWCHKERGEADTALDYLKLVAERHPDKRYLARVNDLKKIIISGQILHADRTKASVRAAAIALRHINYLESLSTDPSFTETVCGDLIAVGLGEPSVQLIQQIMSHGGVDRQADLDAVLVESYLAANQPVLAMSAASYFLSRKQPAWRAVRLHRGLGLALLQGGDWISAASHLQQAKTGSASWRLEDELALIEAELRSNGAIAPIEARVNNIINSKSARSEGESGWLARLAAEVALRAGHMPDEAALAQLPPYLLFQAAGAARDKADYPLEEKLLTRVERGTTSWGKLAKAERELAAMQREFETMRKTLTMESVP